MQTYGGKFQKKAEETRERLLREKISLIKTISVLGSLILLGGSGGYIAYKNYRVNSWNEDVLMKTRETWKGLDRLESDLMSSVLFLKGCRKDMVFQETSDGFQLQVVEMRNQSMEVLQNAPEYSDLSVPVYLGSGIRPGDELVFCNKEEEKKVKLQVIRSNPRWNFHYLIFPEKVTFNNDLPANLIKFSPITYRWEKQGEEEKLFRSRNGEEIEVLNGIQSHKITYEFKDNGKSYFAMDLTMLAKFQNGDAIEIRRNIPLESFQRMPRELEGQVP